MSYLTLKEYDKKKYSSLFINPKGFPQFMFRTIYSYLHRYIRWCIFNILNTSSMHSFLLSYGLGALKNQSLPNEYRQTSIKFLWLFWNIFVQFCQLFFCSLRKKKWVGIFDRFIPGSYILNKVSSSVANIIPLC